MKVIGAGFGRTGTMSLKVALEMLGLGPCYHMVEVLDQAQNPDHIKIWTATGRGEPINAQALFARYQSGVDFPVACFWHELSRVFPEAKFILTVRDPQSWYESVSKTIYAVGRPPSFPDFGEMVDLLIWNGYFSGRFEDRDHALSVFEHHNQQVQNTLDAKRLLVFNVAEGWEPLCHFLEVEVPTQPFPRLNDTAEFLQRIAQMQTAHPE